MALCDLPDVEAQLGSELADDYTRIATLIEQAQGILEGLTGRLFTQVTSLEVDTADLRQQDGVIWLASYPLTAVAIAPSSGDPYVDGTHYSWQTDGRIRRLGAGGDPSFSWAWEPLRGAAWPVGTTITYSAGFPDDASGVPQDLRTLCAQVAADMYANRGANGVTQESLGSWSASYITRSGNLTDQQEKILRRYRRAWGSVPIS